MSQLVCPEIKAALKKADVELQGQIDELKEDVRKLNKTTDVLQTQSIDHALNIDRLDLVQNNLHSDIDRLDERTQVHRSYIRKMWKRYDNYYVVKGDIEMTEMGGSVPDSDGSEQSE